MTKNFYHSNGMTNSINSPACLTGSHQRHGRSQSPFVSFTQTRAYFFGPFRLLLLTRENVRAIPQKYNRHYYLILQAWSGSSPRKIEFYPCPDHNGSRIYTKFFNDDGQTYHGKERKLKTNMPDLISEPDAVR